MSRAGIEPVIPDLYVHLGHSVSEWLESRVNRALFAAVSFASLMATANQGQEEDVSRVSEIVSDSVAEDTIYVLRFPKTVGCLFIGKECAFLLKFTPSNNNATFEVLELINYGELKTNELLDSMTNKGTIEKYHHVEAEEFTVSSELLSNSLNNNSEDQ